VNIEPESDEADTATENEDLTPETTEVQDQAEPQKPPGEQLTEGEESEQDQDSLEEDGADSETDDSLGTVADVHDLGPCKRRVIARVGADKVDERLDKAYDELIQTVSLPGFRRGRVPRRLLEKRYGKEVDKDIKEQLLAESFAEVVEQKGLRLLGAPDYEKVEFGAGTDFCYETDVQVQPEFDLPRYKGIEIEHEAVPVEEDAVEKELESLRRDRTEMVPIGPMEAGDDDQFIGTFKLFDGDVEVKESDRVAFSPKSNCLEHFKIEGLGELVKGWERSSVGTSEARPLVAEVTVPQSYPDEMLSGKDLRLEFTLDETRTPEIPELDEKFALGLGCESVEDLCKTVRERVEKDALTRQEKLIEKTIMDRLLEAVDLDLPQDLIERQRRLAEEQVEQKLLASGNNADGAPDGGPGGSDGGPGGSDGGPGGSDGTAGKPESEVATLREQAAEKAEEELSRELKEFFLLERIGEKEKIVATEDEVKQRVQLMALVYGVPAATMIREFKESGRIGEIRVNLRNEKVKTYLRKKARISSPQDADSNGSTEQPTSASEDGPESTEFEEETSHS